MYLNTHYITFNKNLTINNIHYNNIRILFIIYYIKYIDNNYHKALNLSKYYLYYKIFNCIYSTKIMNIIYNIEFCIKNL
jgi:hypothetical protein